MGLVDLFQIVHFAIVLNGHLLNCLVVVVILFLELFFYLAQFGFYFVELALKFNVFFVLLLFLVGRLLELKFVFWCEFFQGLILFSVISLGLLQILFELMEIIDDFTQLLLWSLLCITHVIVHSCQSIFWVFELFTHSSLSFSEFTNLVVLAFNAFHKFFYFIIFLLFKYWDFFSKAVVLGVKIALFLQESLTHSFLVKIIFGFVLEFLLYLRNFESELFNL